MPKISVIIPVYNTEKYLKECLDSIINQTLKDIEIIIINDGSPGNADEICKKYAEKDSRIKYFSKKNEGVAIARNFGISKATGNYIYCVDSDDTIKKNLIQEIYDSFITNDCDFLVVGSQFNNDIDAIGCLPTWGFAVKKEMLDKYTDVRFQEGISPCEDGLFSHKLMALTNKISKLNSDGYIYRINPDSCEHNLSTARMLNDIPNWFKFLTSFYDKYNLWNTHKMHLLYFIQNEPFGRLNILKLNLKQKIFLADVMYSFIKKNNLIPCNRLEKMNVKFQMFLDSKSYLEYYYRKKIYKIRNGIKPFLQTIFSLKNSPDQKHKIITILGIKIKFRRKATKISENN